MPASRGTQDPNGLQAVGAAILLSLGAIFVLTVVLVSVFSLADIAMTPTVARGVLVAPSCMLVALAVWVGGKVRSIAGKGTYERRLRAVLALGSGTVVLLIGGYVLRITVSWSGLAQDLSPAWMYVLGWAPSGLVAGCLVANWLPEAPFRSVLLLAVLAPIAAAVPVLAFWLPAGLPAMLVTTAFAAALYALPLLAGAWLGTRWSAQRFFQG